MTDQVEEEPESVEPVSVAWFASAAETRSDPFPTDALAAQGDELRELREDQEMQPNTPGRRR